MKVIDLLNKIANGEEVPEEINFDGEEYRLNYANTYVDKNGKYIFQKYNNLILNDEVEIIEEPQEPQEHKIPEKLDIVLLDQSDNWTRKYNKNLKDFESAHIELNPYVIDVIRQNTLEFQSKINEILDYLENNV